jgi:hypothetical protein
MMEACGRAELGPVCLGQQWTSRSGKTVAYITACLSCDGTEVCRTCPALLFRSIFHGTRRLTPTNTTTAASRHGGRVHRLRAAAHDGPPPLAAGAEAVSRHHARHLASRRLTGERANADGHRSDYTRRGWLCSPDECWGGDRRAALGQWGRRCTRPGGEEAFLFARRVHVLFFDPAPR